MKTSPSIAELFYQSISNVEVPLRRQELIKLPATIVELRQPQSQDNDCAVLTPP